MKFLLDTHALLWWLSDDAALGAKARDIIADPANDILVSVVSLWEIVVKVRVGKLQADIKDISAAVETEGFELLGISPGHLLRLAKLPRHHKDPFDHLLIAQAVTEGATFVSEDQHISKYAVSLLNCTDAPSA